MAVDINEAVDGVTITFSAVPRDAEGEPLTERVRDGLVVPD